MVQGDQQPYDLPLRPGPVIMTPGRRIVGARGALPAKRAAVNVQRLTKAPSARRMGRWTARLLAFVFLGLVLAAVAVVVVIPRATHGQAMTVLTGSMTPGIPVGSVVVVRPVDPGTLEVGDVATYQKEKDQAVFVTHRIIEIDSSTRPTTYVFKGDANRGPDLEPIVPDRIIGKVWFHVPYLGTIRDGLKGSGGVTLLVMMLLGGYAVSQVRAGLEEKRRGGGDPRKVQVDRRLVVARFSRIGAKTARSLPSSWRAVTLRDDGAVLTVLIAPDPEDLDDVLEELRSWEPQELTVSTPAGWLVLPGPDDCRHQRRERRPLTVPAHCHVGAASCPLVGERRTRSWQHAPSVPVPWLHRLTRRRLMPPSPTSTPRITARRPECGHLTRPRRADRCRSTPQWSTAPWEMIAWRAAITRRC